MVGIEGGILRESKSVESGDGIRIRTGDRHGTGGDAGLRQCGKRLEWGRMERSEHRPVGSKCKLVIYYIRKESSDWVAAVLGLKNHPIISKLSSHDEHIKRKTGIKKERKKERTKERKKERKKEKLTKEKERPNERKKE